MLLSACVAIPHLDDKKLSTTDYALVGAPNVPSAQWWQAFDFAPIRHWRELALQRAPSRGR